MTIFLTLFFATLAASSTLLLGGLLSHRAAHWLAAHAAPVVAFASGALLLLSFGEVLPEAIALGGAGVPLWVLAGVLFFYFIENFFYLHGCPDHLAEHACKNHVLGPVAAIGLGIHSFFDGLLIVLAGLASPTLGWLTAAGIAIHNLPAGAILHSLTCLGRSSRRSLVYVLAVAATTPAAVLVAPFLAGFSELWLGRGLAVVAGGMLYITLADLLPRTHEKRSYANLAWLILGGGVIWLLQLLLPEVH